MNNYEDLAFKPAMTWEELCEWVKEKYDGKIIRITSEGINVNHLCFYKEGKIQTGFIKLSDNRTYEQMKNIIDNLYGED